MTTRVKTLAEQARALASFLPGGKHFEAKNLQGSNVQKLISGFSQELLIADGYIREYSKEIIPDQTVQFIEEWESAVGIPDDCFYIAGTISERRNNVLVKLAALGVKTVDDFEALATALGLTVTVAPMGESSLFPLTLPFILTDVATTKYTIVVSFEVGTPNVFPLTFPISFGDSIIQVMECLFRKLKPANCDIIYQEVAP